MMFAFDVVFVLAFFAFGASALQINRRATGGYLQNPSGTASFTQYTGCEAPGAAIVKTTIILYSCA